MQMTGLLLMFEPGGKKGKILTFFSTFKVVSQRNRPVYSGILSPPPGKGGVNKIKGFGKGDGDQSVEKTKVEDITLWQY